MKLHALSLLATLTLTACGVGSTTDEKKEAIKPATSDASPAVIVSTSETATIAATPTQTSPGDKSTSTDTKGGGKNTSATSNGTKDQSAMNSSTDAKFVVDPDTLSFPVVFHLGQSGPWKTEESLKHIIAEVQRILGQAKLEILPQYTQSAAATALLDVTYLPAVPGEPSVNGISYGGADLEVFVRDQVGLSQVADRRPTQIPASRTIKGAKPGDTYTLTSTEAKQARTTAHEICHQLGLSHRQDNTNLLASGTTGWTLNADEIATVRARATQKFAAKRVDRFEP